MKKLHLIGLRVFLYKGNYEREIIEVRDRMRNFIKEGEYILANQLQSLSFANNPLFEEVDISKVVFAGEKEEEVFVSPLALTDDEIKTVIEEYATRNNLTVTFSISEVIENAEGKEESNKEPDLSNNSGENEESTNDVTDIDVGDMKEPTENANTNEDQTLDLESIEPLESFETKETLEAYGLTFGINLNKTKKLENMYADLLAHIETLKIKA